MVSAVNGTNIAQQSTIATKEADIKKIVKYVNNETLQDVPDTFVSTVKGGASSALLFEGLPFFNFLRRNKKLNNTFNSANLKELGNFNKTALDNLLKGKDKLSKRILDFISHSDKAKNVFIDEIAAVKAQAKAKGLAEKAANTTGKNAKVIAQKAKTAAEKATTASTKASASLNAVKNGTTKAVGKLGKFKNFLKSSGAGTALICSGLFECFLEVVPTFKELGFEKGMKQVGKSAIKVIGDTFGFIAGGKIGIVAGTAIGTAICPGIGTAVGAVCGFIGGFIGSFALGKVTKAITGKSEREKVKEQQENETTNKLVNDEKTLNELKNEAMVKIKENTQATGKLSEEDAIALKALENLGMTNPFAV